MSFIHASNLCQALAETGSEASASVFCLMILVVFSKKNTEVSMGGGIKENSLSCIIFLGFLIHDLIWPPTPSQSVKSVLLSFIYKCRTEAKTEVKIYAAGSMTGSLKLDLSTLYSVYL